MFSPLWVFAAGCGFLLAPYFHAIASIPIVLGNDYLANCMGAGGACASLDQQACLMVAAHALHASLFGFFALGIALGSKMKYQALCTVVATVSCAAWWIWIQTQAPDTIPTLDLRKYLLADHFTFMSLMTTSMAAMAAASFTRLLQTYLYYLNLKP